MAERAPIGLGVVPAGLAELPSLGKTQASWRPTLGGTTGQRQLCSTRKPVLEDGRDGREIEPHYFLLPALLISTAGIHVASKLTSGFLPTQDAGGRASPGWATLS